ncbi:MAG: hypothetical protein PHX18_05305 [Candidatus Gastranaerophilales bacterium]|nr:hypothetical protein [Candidatus Gastranaerophilales bacterium]
MKKIMGLLLLLSVLILSNQVFAQEIDLTKYNRITEDATRVGFKILNANNISERMNFDSHWSNRGIVPIPINYKQHSMSVDNKLYHYREVSVCLDQVPYIDNEDELAAILAHEIAHGVDSYQGLISGYFRYFLNDFFFFNAKRTDRNMDKKAVDYMVKAGYNPVALITIINKSNGQKRTDWYLRTTQTSKKMISVYLYIKRNYPQYLSSSYALNNQYYRNFLVSEGKSIAKQDAKKPRFWD